MLDKVTIIIKAFERPHELDTLLEGLRDKYPKVAIHVADDSRDPQHNSLATKTITLPFDTGISAGRNKLLQSVTTPYCVLMDDDFIIYEGTNLEQMVRLMEETDFDLIGGAVHEPPTYERLQCCHITLKGNVLFRRKPKELELRDGVLKCDVVRNFFITRPEKVLALGGWDESLKQGEHTPFFLHLKGKLKIGYTPDVGVLHQKGIGSPFYQQYRARGRPMLEEHLKNKYGITETRWQSET
jgi:glycosyltransferase involved in cell wall biosynthesis